MTTSEVADYLRIKERKVYDLVATQRIPCTRVTGKWLFPRAMIDLWLLRNTEFSGHAVRPEAPPVIGGSHDPLLEWAVRESGSELATLFDGSLDGVRRILDHQVRACGVHVINADNGSYNVHLIDQNPGRSEMVVLQWAWRDQGLIVAAGNPLHVESLADVAERQVRLIDRQQSAGSHLLLTHLLATLSIPLETLNRVARPARNESDAALAVADGVADTALGIAAVAHQYRLDFIPLHRERYDLLLKRHDYFEPPLQVLLSYARTPSFAEKARALGGYDITALGQVVYNGC
ncbi:MAG: helix-turn-helix domain-containing protein [Rhodanobacter sp.]|nr:MAG: helix-turn-helix domain-containing protein [Rhodanobacter sp.]TAM40443.1 MAG: helix-turn-helix domain-containing protein [Rhodanobacter sp.]